LRFWTLLGAGLVSRERVGMHATHTGETQRPIRGRYV
jgi:hypothetical protein